MIKATELRKGNLFLHKGKAIEVNGIDEDDYILVYNSFYDDCIEHIKESDAEPIMLTKEWLERCGFKDMGIYERADLHVYGDSSIDIARKGDEYYLYITFADEHNNVIYGTPFKHLHQLQNLFFTLTGEELTIKL